jgi:hypothetical protein
MSKRAIRSGFGSCCITGVVEGVEHFEIGMWQGPESALMSRKPGDQRMRRIAPNRPSTFGDACALDPSTNSP